MKVIYITIWLLVIFKPIFGQEQIKKIIYEDLFFLNNMYDGCILQPEWGSTPIDSFKRDIKYIKIVKIDSINPYDSPIQYYFVEVKINLAENTIYGVMHGGLLDYTFSYVLYRKFNKYYKIDGFFVSEVLTAPLDNNQSLFETLKKRKKIPKKFIKYMRKRNTKKLQKYLSVSILERMNYLGFNFNCEPYVKDVICWL